MQRSVDRILTTHTGSLPRPADLVQSMFAREEGAAIDAGALDARITSAVREVAARQATVGLDVINDGEASKPSYATYIKDRLSGFGGESHPLQYADLSDYPALARQVFNDPGRARRKTPACDGPIAARDTAAVGRDIDNLRAALTAAGRRDGFLSAASPGVISLFFKN